MREILLTVVCAVLLLNLLIAGITMVRRHPSSWLLVVLLAGTVGAATAAVMAVIDGGNERYLDVALVLTGTAVVTAAVRAAMHRSGTSTPDAPDAHPEPASAGAGR